MWTEEDMELMNEYFEEEEIDLNESVYFDGMEITKMDEEVYVFSREYDEGFQIMLMQGSLKECLDYCIRED